MLALKQQAWPRFDRCPGLLCLLRYRVLRLFLCGLWLLGLDLSRRLGQGFGLIFGLNLRLAEYDPGRLAQGLPWRLAGAGRATG
jgi:hypothetical protein